MSLYTISQASAEVSLTAHTLRYYEKEGLLPNVKKDSAGRRNYHQDDIQRIGFIKCLKGTGMSLKQIKEYGVLFAQGKKKSLERNNMLEAHREKILTEIKIQKKYLKMIEAKIEMRI
jgi:DNA-binding transcriptional MerR regulator|tara:strand:- start:5625 stop:5975 length:351 start_codon:yes stop_codon:yes gene_type:complete